MKSLRNLLHKLLLCATFRQNDVEIIICEHIKGWRLTTPQMECMGTLDRVGTPIGTDDAFRGAIRHAREAGDVVSIQAIENLKKIFEESFGQQPGEFAVYSVNGKG